MSIFVTRQINPKGINILKEHFQHVEIWPEDRPCPREIILEKAKEVDALLTLLTDKIDEEVLSNQNLKIVSQSAVGIDNIDVKSATAHNVVVCNTPGVLTESCADLAWALIMSVARRVVESYCFVQEGKWVSYDPNGFLGTDVFGATIGIIGPGRIGQAVARRSLGFKMKILYHGPHQKGELDQIGGIYSSLEDLLKESDFIVLTCPLKPDTRHLINEERLKMMKKTSILINIARGPVVDTSALVDALREGTIAAAGLDVVDPEPIPKDHPLLSLKNCVQISHIASATTATRMKMATIAANAIVDCLNGKKPQFCANPDVIPKIGFH